MVAILLFCTYIIEVAIIVWLYVAACFDIFDQDGNGYLDSDELMSILELAATGDRIRDRDVACTLEEMMEKIDIDGTSKSISLGS